MWINFLNILNDSSINELDLCLTILRGAHFRKKQRHCHILHYVVSAKHQVFQKCLCDGCWINSWMDKGTCGALFLCCPDLGTYCLFFIPSLLPPLLSPLLSTLVIYCWQLKVAQYCFLFFIFRVHTSTCEPYFLKYRKFRNMYAYHKSLIYFVYIDSMDMARKPFLQFTDTLN